ncbi:unnamed protein product, partial [Adineta ricciae]
MSLSNVPKLQELFFQPWKLPLETLTFVDKDFYLLIEHLVGPSLSRLLKVQEINSVPILLLTADVFQHLFLNTNDFEINLLRDELLLKVNNDQLIVKDANCTKMRCLLNILHVAKERKSKQSQRIIPKSQTNCDSSLVSLPAMNATTTVATSTFTLDDQRNHLLKCIGDWSSLNDNFLNLTNFKLEDGVNFKLNLKGTTNGFHAMIECQCKVP